MPVHYPLVGPLDAPRARLGVGVGVGDGQEHVDVIGSMLGASIFHHAMVPVIHASLFWTLRSYRF